MNSRNLDNLVELDLLNKEPGDQQEFDGLLRYGRGSLKDAGREALEIASRFQLAYEGAHSLALAALRWCGYRPRNKRYIVFQCLPHTLGGEKAGGRILAEAYGELPRPRGGLGHEDLAQPRVEPNLSEQNLQLLLPRGEDTFFHLGSI